MGIMVCGLNGVGKSTLGRALADRLGYFFIDNEELYFSKTDLNYIFASPRSKDEVIKLLNNTIHEHENFVFAAVKGDYGDELLAHLRYIILIEVPKDIRLERVRGRSYDKFGERMLPGRDLYERENHFFEKISSRPEDFVTEWLQAVDSPVIRVDGSLLIDENVKYIIEQM